jgi:hypothetical protein
VRLKKLFFAQYKNTPWWKILYWLMQLKGTLKAKW